MKIARKKQIKLQPRLRKALITELGISEMTLYNALNYKLDSELAHNIRLVAWKRYDAKVLISTTRCMTEEDV